MATGPFRPDHLLSRIQQSLNDMRNLAADMAETTLLTRAVIDTTRDRMREADRLLEEHEQAAPVAGL